ncbi:hypothetical protein [Nitrincola sp. MINF-07-Sa-05]|uniref:hypothetical protein n=1 Tax=Nitrincola salilacus TaxID=3400273 RepID=UPI0039180A8C
MRAVKANAIEVYVTDFAFYTPYHEAPTGFIASSSQQQAGAVAEISNNVEELNTGAEQTEQAIHEIAKASEHLAATTVELDELVSKFKVV